VVLLPRERWCPSVVSGEGVDPGAMALDLVVVAIFLVALVASLDHVVKVFTGGRGKGVAGLSRADFDDAQGCLQRKP
jgi:hypothetical protein